MTDREKAIIMARTGIVMLEGEKFSVFHKYIEDICGRPIFTHELADDSVWREIKKKSEEDFLKVCRSEDTLDKVLEIIDDWKMKGVETITINGSAYKHHVETLRKMVLALKEGE